MTITAARPDPHTSATLRKAAGENFPVAPRFLPRAWRADLMAVYGFSRLVDDIGDGDLAPGGGDAVLLGLEPARAEDRPAMLDALEADLLRVFRTADRPSASDAPPGGGPRHPLMAALVPAVHRGPLTIEPFQRLIEANRRDQRVHRYETHEQLLEYCTYSADPVGRLVLQLTGTTTPERARRSDAVCTALQLVEHLQDVAEDHARGRIYLPAEEMRRFSVTEADLAAPVAGASLRALVAFQADRARRLLDDGAPLVGSVQGRLRVLLAGFVGGGRAALASLRAAHYDVLGATRKPTTTGLLHAAGTTLRRGM